MEIRVKRGSGYCDDCGSYEWQEVTAPMIKYKSRSDDHLDGGPSLEDCLTEILSLLGHTVTYMDVE